MKKRVKGKNNNQRKMKKESKRKNNNQRKMKKSQRKNDNRKNYMHLIHLRFRCYFFYNMNAIARNINMFINKNI